MKCYEIIKNHPRQWNKDTHPVIARIKVDAQHLDQLERVAGDLTLYRFLGHDLADHGQIIVHVACTSADAKSRLEDRWA